MAKNLNYQATLGLSVKGFQKGVRAVQNSINGLKMKFMAFASAMGAGLGLTEIARTLADTAKEMDKSQTTLKNVSNGFQEYGENQRFLIEMANKYNQNILVLTDNFAKFHSSSDQANVSLKDQQKIFESLTRASAFYNLSADETNGVFLAITQMMSKGKVASEELRRQLGERLPGAFGLMAKALGMTTAELDKALKDGKVMAADALPKLADELNKVTANVNVDTIQGWTNRLKNSVMNLTKKLKVDSIYKNVVKTGTKTIEWIGNHLKDIQNMFVGVATAIGSMNLWGKFTKGYDEYAAPLQKELDKVTLQMEKFAETSRLKQMGGVLEMKDGRWLPDERKMEEITNKLYKSYGDMAKAQRDAFGEWQDIKKEAVTYNSLLAKSEELQTSMTKESYLLKQVWVDLKNTLFSFAKSAVLGGIITLLSMGVSKLIQWRKEVKKIKNYLSDMNNELKEFVEKVGQDESVLEAFAKVLEPAKDKKGNYMKDKDGNLYYSTKYSDKDREEALKEINRMLGREGKEAFTLASAYEDIAKAVEKYKEERKKVRTFEKSSEMLNNAQNHLTELQDQKRKLEEDIRNAQAKQKTARTQEMFDYYVGVESEADTALNSPKFGIEKQIRDTEQAIAMRGAEVASLLKDVKQIEKEIDEDDYGGAVKTYDQIQLDYSKDLKILDSKLKDGILNQEEYNEALKNLKSSTLDSIYNLSEGGEKFKVGADEFSRKLIEDIKGFRTVDPTELEKLEKEFREASKKLHNQFDAGLIDSDKLQEELDNLREETVKALAEMGEMTGSLKGLAFELDYLTKQAKARKNLKEILKAVNSSDEKRDSTFDYKKPKSEIYKEEADWYSNKAESLKTQIEELKEMLGGNDNDMWIKYLNEQLKEALKNSDNLEKSAVLAELQEDIANYQQTLTSDFANGIDNVADAVDRLRSGMESLMNPDMTEWERFVAVLNMIIQTFDTLTQSIEVFEKMKETMNMLTLATAQQNEIMSKGAKENLALTTANTMAKQGEAMASGTASAAKLSFPFNLAAIATTVALIAGIFSSIPKYAKGGIFKSGSKTGDLSLARLNDGEMILNPMQQKKLFNVINGNGIGGGNVEFRIKGSDLVGTINNYQKKITK